MDQNYDKSIESSYLSYQDANNLYGWPMCQNLPVGGFKWIEDLFQFNDKNSNKGYIFEVGVEYPKN